MKHLMIDASACQGCHFCEIACSLAHPPGRVNPRQSRIRVQEDLVNKAFNPVTCKQCKRAACIEACPYDDVIRQHPELRVPLIDPEKCTGCMACLEACPFDAMFRDEETGLPLVCDLCGGDPQCVKLCPTLPTRSHPALGYATPEEWSRVKSGQKRVEG